MLMPFHFHFNASIAYYNITIYLYFVDTKQVMRESIKKGNNARIYKSLNLKFINCDGCALMILYFHGITDMVFNKLCSN